MHFKAAHMLGGFIYLERELNKMVIDEKEILSLLEDIEEPDREELLRILEEADSLKGLGAQQVIRLLNVKKPEHLRLLYERADRVKRKVFGDRVVLFAPLYLSNYCVNSCRYCGFRSANKELPRKRLTEREIVAEAKTLEAMGFKRLLLVVGEDPLAGVDYLVRAIRAIYRETGIRIVHLNAPPMEVEALRELKRAGYGVFQVFQETYHRPTYEEMHPQGPKKDYLWRITVMDRALEAGFGDVGIGALLGLYDYRFDVLATIMHSNHLYRAYGTHAHTISIPRMRPAKGAAITSDRLRQYSVTDEELKKITALYRLSVPTAGVVVSTREGAALRRELLRIGASQMSAASRTDPGGYRHRQKTLEQFSTDDKRGLLEVMLDVIEEGRLPSLCATCYRVGRTGSKFTSITSRGLMKGFCQANAIITLKEYMLEAELDGLKGAFHKAIEKALEDIKDEKTRKYVIEKIRELEEGRRDLYL